MCSAMHWAVLLCNASLIQRRAAIVVGLRCAPTCRVLPGMCSSTQQLLTGAVLACWGVQDDVLLAYQIAFDLVENELQSFILKVSCRQE